MNVPTPTGPPAAGPSWTAPAGTGQPTGQVTPGKGRYALGAGLILLGLTVSIGVVIFAFVRVIRIVADTTPINSGQVNTRVLDPDTYSVFSESDSADVTVRGPDGQIALEPVTDFRWITINNFSGQAIYTFDVDSTATFEITNNGESRIAVGGAAWDGFGRTILFAAIGGTVLVIVGTVLLVATGQQRRKSKRALMAAAVGLPDQYPGWGTGPQQPQYAPQYQPGATQQYPGEQYPGQLYPGQHYPGQAPPSPPGFESPPSAGRPSHLPEQAPGQAPQYESGWSNSPPRQT